ncbi:MAG: MgtC/SapB family protein [Candidatus Gracilibacteria bacterium]|nr:MgtC/SapB family protein [Candidatus Gracilibacteria bacterium]
MESIITANITEFEILLRLSCAAFLAGLIGLEREYKSQPAGLRTHILIALGSALFMIISIILPEVYQSAVSDPGRIAAQVVSGVGFLGAGAIMKIGINTTGLATAANIWATAAIGLAAGAGLYMIAVITTVFILGNLIFVEKFKSKMVNAKRFCSIQLEFDKQKLSDKDLKERLSNIPMTIVTKNLKEDSKSTDIKIISKINSTFDISEVHIALKDMKGLNKIAIGEYVK